MVRRASRSRVPERSLPRPSISKAGRGDGRNGGGEVDRDSGGEAGAVAASGDPTEPRYWLFKSEPGSRLVKGRDVKFSIDDLEAMPNQTTPWEGVRNYQARNLMRDQMRVGDLGLFYHSSCRDPAIMAIVKVVRAAYPDSSSWDPTSPYYDPKSSAATPRWFMVDVQLVRRLPQPVYLRQLKELSDRLPGLPLLAKGSRLSVQPVPGACWQVILDESGVDG